MTTRVGKVWEGVGRFPDTCDGPISRRGFLRASVMGAATVFGVGSLALPAAAQGKEVNRWVADFARYTGLGQVSTNLDEYLKALRDGNRPEWQGWITALQTSRARMSRGGFSDLSVSTVYRHESTLFYPARRPGLTFDACAPFIHAGRWEDGVNVMTEGPSLIGLALAAEEVSQNENVVFARRLLFATRQIQKYDGNFREGYRMTDKIQTEDGRVAVGYRVTSYDPQKKEGLGTVRVVAVHDKKQMEIVNKEYDVNFRQA